MAEEKITDEEIAILLIALEYYILVFRNTAQDPVYLDLFEKLEKWSKKK